MKSLVVVGPGQKGRDRLELLGEIPVGNSSIEIGRLEAPQPNFDAEASKNRRHVLLEVSTLACNFRDKGILMDNYQQLERLGKPYLPFGSDFCARVVATGADVPEFKVSDRVMGNFAYPEAPAPGVLPGVATNFASLGWLRLHAGKLTLVPEEMSDSQAAAFALGAQTAAGMIRRSGILQTGGVPVVLSARSATSLFVAQQLIGHGYQPHCLSSSEWTPEQRRRLPGATFGVLRPEQLPGQDEYSQFSHAFDPFFDMNLEAASLLLGHEGTYVTCGLRDQHPLLSDGTPEEAGVKLRRALALAVVKNLAIKGNCLGTSADLEDAVQQFCVNQAGPIIDSQFESHEAPAFLARSFFDPGRLGKSVISMEPSSVDG